MATPTLDVVHLEAGTFHRRHRTTNVIEFTAGKNIFGDRPLFGPPAPPKPRRLRKNGQLQLPVLAGVG